MSTRLTIAAMLLMLGAAPIAFAQQDAGAAKAAEKQKEEAKPAPLNIGDVAPPLAVEKFLKGEPITGFEKGRVYVVEFWATWCGPCITSMPHITKLQKEFKDRGVTIVGVNVWEDQDYNADTLAGVEAFVRENDAKMGYTVAYDGAAKRMAEAYMAASGSNGIPTSFVVNADGRIAWIGHPMRLDKVLEEVVAGKWDMAKAKHERDASMAVSNAMRENRGDPEATLAALEEVAIKFPEMKERVDSVRWGLLLQTGQHTKAYAILGPMVDKAIADENAPALNQYAWAIVDPDGEVETKDLDLALRAAEKAVEFTKSKDGAILDTLARVWFLKGDVAKAIDLQVKAIEAAPEEMKEHLQPALDEYKAAKKKG